MKRLLQYIILFILIIFILPVILTKRDRNDVLTGSDVQVEENNVMPILRQRQKNKITSCKNQ